MKFNKKKITVVALAVCVIAILSMGTLAWFNASDHITNRFQVATSDSAGTPDFSINVWETDPDTNAPTENTVTYKDILPGSVLAKNPTVVNTGHYSQFVRVKVTFDEYAKLMAACQRYSTVEDDLCAWLNVDSAVWTRETESGRNPVIDGDTATYVYYLNTVLDEDEFATLFTTVTIPTEFVNADLTLGSGDFSITVTAEAIQSENMGASVTTAKQAFDAYWVY